jgi:hypothetical protein
MASEMPAFEVPQFYETSIAMRDTAGDVDREFLFLSLPASSVHKDNEHLLDKPYDLLALLGLPEARDLRVAQIPDAIFALLRAEDLGGDAGSVLERVADQDWLALQLEVDPAAALFAEYLAFGEVVPFEQSKATVAALATKAMKSYAAAGTAAGLGLTVAPALGPHGAVAYLAVAPAAVLAIVVVDSIGVAVGWVVSDRTAEAIQAARRGISRLMRRPQPDEAGDKMTPERVAVEQMTPEQQAAEEKAAGEEATELERRAYVARKRQRIYAQARLRPREPGPAPGGET